MFTIANIAQSFINNSQSLFCVLLFRCCCRSRLSLRRFNMRTARIQFSLRPSILLYTSIGNTHTHTHAHTHTHTHTHTHCLSLTSFLLHLLLLLHFHPGLQVKACNLLRPPMCGPATIAQCFYNLLIADRRGRWLLKKFLVQLEVSYFKCTSTMNVAM